MRLKEVIYKLKLIYRILCRILHKAIALISFLASFAAICFLIYQFGFEETATTKAFIQKSYEHILQIFLYTGIISILLDPKGFRKEKGFWVEIVILAALLFVVYVNTLPHNTEHILIHRINLALIYILLVFISIISVSKQIMTTLQRHLKPEMMFAYSFLFIILTGAFLLMLPNAHNGHLRFIDALFTSTSAVCVTGLTVVETATNFTTTGLVIIMILIQIGGIGVMTFTSFFAMSFFSQTSFQDQMKLKNILNEDSLNNIFRTLFYILLTTAIVEAVGAYVIWYQIADIPTESIPNKVFFALFHSISAFCNAGFSTLPGNLYDPTVRHLYGLQSWMALLIILGGIGFPIVFNYGKLFNYAAGNLIKKIIGKQKRNLYRVHIVSTTTRIVIPTTLLLLIGGTALFWLFENDNTLKGLPTIGKLATSFMGAVTPRTAGFNNVPMGAMLTPTIFLTILLMWIGASPMSTGGGIKTTTFVIALKNIYNIIKGKNRVETANRQLTVDNVNRASAIIFLSLIWIGIATMLIVILEPHASITQALFEITSAIGTVGLTLDLTPTLSDTSKIIVSITMFVGRVGLITLLSGLVKQQSSQNYTYADETVIL